LDRLLVTTSLSYRPTNVVHLRAPVDLVGQDPRSDALGDGDDLRHLLGGEDGAGRVVRIADRDQPGVRPHDPLELLEVRAPPVGLDEVEAVHLASRVGGHAGHLPVPRLQHDHVVARRGQGGDGEAVALRGADGDQDLRGVDPGIEPGDRPAELLGAVHRRVVQVHVQQRLDRLGGGDQLTHQDRRHPAVGQVEGHLHLVERLPLLELERDEGHGFSSDGRNRGWGSGHRAAAARSDATGAGLERPRVTFV
jgi:hypothetical protein